MTEKCRLRNSWSCLVWASETSKLCFIKQKISLFSKKPSSLICCLGLDPRRAIMMFVPRLLRKVLFAVHCLDHYPMHNCGKEANHTPPNTSLN